MNFEDRIKNYGVKNQPDYKYSGSPDWSTFVDIILEVENLMAKMSIKENFIRKSLYVFTELFQNSVTHRVNNSPLQFFFVSQNNSLHFLTENIIKNEKTAKFTKLIEKLNSLDEIELKKIHLQNLTSGSLSGAVNATPLGLICIRRKSKNKIYFNISEIDEKTSTVSIIASVNIS